MLAVKVRSVLIMVAEDAELRRLRDLCRYERDLWHQGIVYVAGVDEAGRGPLAGPVLAAAVIWPQKCVVPEVDDSKKLTKQQREMAARRIRELAIAVGQGAASVEEIDSRNILRASLLAMQRAIDALTVSPQHVLVDGRDLPALSVPATAIVGGDGKSQSIAAASIIAKVARDALMDELALDYPQYGFERHRGYPTPEHLAALAAHGPCAVHRRTFKPVRRLIDKGLFGW